MSATQTLLQNAQGQPLIKGSVTELADELIALKIPGTNYRPCFTLKSETPDLQTGQIICGIVRCQSQRIDTAATGGRFVEPCFGRPRHIQGRVTGGSAARNELYVSTGALTFIVTPMQPQKANEFTIGQLVMFDAKSGSTFEPADCVSDNG